ncbi:MAG: hypothetical protein JWO52_7035, partial [Gammaproteobacteria bacterium]|nr:hypothetical protein [Gammaproteobacteria bacterium]
LRPLLNIEFHLVIILMARMVTAWKTSADWGAHRWHCWLWAPCRSKPAMPAEKMSGLGHTLRADTETAAVYRGTGRVEPADDLALAGAVRGVSRHAILARGHRRLDVTSGTPTAASLAPGVIFRQRLRSIARTPSGASGSETFRLRRPAKCR